MDFLDKIKRLPENIKQFLYSDRPRHETEKACFLYGLKESAVSIVSDPVAPIFIREMELRNLPQILSSNLHIADSLVFGIAYELNRRIFSLFPDYFKDARMLLQQWQQQKANPIISEEEAMRKVLEIEPWINQKDEEEEEEMRIPTGASYASQQNTSQTLVIDALKKYPEIGEQLVTSQPIRLKGFPESVRPSIKNWISDYTMNLGYDNRSSMMRNEYLFRNENTRNLSESDRKKLSYILKAFDDRESVTINVTTKQIIFPSAEEQKIEASQFQRRMPEEIKSPVNVASPQYFNTQPQKQKQEINRPGEAEKLKFSYSQKFPYEKAKEKPIVAQIPQQPVRFSPAPPVSRPTQPQNVFQIPKTQEAPVQKPPVQPVQNAYSLPPKPQPMNNPPLKINPVSRWDEEENEPLPKNVVDLKSHNT